MPTPIARPKPPATFEYHYRDHPLVVSRGSPLPVGATATPSGINFVLICRHGTAVWLVLSETCSGEIHAEIPLDPLTNRTGDHWHVRVDGLPEEFCYGYRVDGPKETAIAMIRRIILLDPHARALSCGRPWATGGNLPRRSLMTEFMIDRQRVMNPRIPLEDTIIYELHVRGYTIDPSSGVKYPGTYAGLVEKIDELKALGITAVELLPVDEFDENDCAFVNPLTGEKLRNFWGYNPILFCAPKAAYAHNLERVGPVARISRDGRRISRSRHRGLPGRRLQSHRRGGENGPTYNFRGLDNSLYYMLDEHGRYLNLQWMRQHVQQRPPSCAQLFA